MGFGQVGVQDAVRRRCGRSETVIVKDEDLTAVQYVQLTFSFRDSVKLGALIPMLITNLAALSSLEAPNS